MAQIELILKSIHIEWFYKNKLVYVDYDNK